MRTTQQSDRRRAAVLAVVLGALCALGTLAVALQVQVVGGHALDANLRVDGSGFNTSTSRNRAPGLQSQSYNLTPSFGGGQAGLSSGVYRPGRSTSGGVDTRLSGGRAFTIETGSGTFTTGRAGGGRSDPLRVPTYSALETPTMVQRGTIPGGTPSMRVNRRTGAMVSSSGRAPSNALTSTTYTAARRR